MPATAQPRPFAAVLLQLYTKRPQLAYNGAQRGTPAAARAELWRYALAEAVGTEGALAARAFAKWEVSFNPAGVRIAVVGPSETVQRLLSRVLHLARRQAVAREREEGAAGPHTGAEPHAGAANTLTVAEVAAGRAAALRALRPQLESPPVGSGELLRARDAALRSATAADLEAEIAALWWVSP